ncbi:DUF2513 domain-containing protein [Weissella hellenica]|nr:DUF2513 domain-containing protein [Weissella hellenica]
MVMKLELDNVRDILLDFEKNLQYNEYISVKELDSRAKTLNITKSDYLYTIDKLAEDSIIDVIYGTGKLKDHIFYVKSITSKGHKFLDNIRKEDVWSKTKSIAKKLGTVSLSHIDKIAEGVITTLITKTISGEL